MVDQLDQADLTKLQNRAPLTFVRIGMPPLICIRGTKVEQVSYAQSVEMCNTMNKVGASCRLITIDDGLHGMSSWRAPEMQHWKGEMIAWLNKTLNAPR